MVLYRRQPLLARPFYNNKKRMEAFEERRCCAIFEPVKSLSASTPPLSFVVDVRSHEHYIFPEISPNSNSYRKEEFVRNGFFQPVLWRHSVITTVFWVVYDRGDNDDHHRSVDW